MSCKLTFYNTDMNRDKCSVLTKSKNPEVSCMTRAQLTKIYEKIFRDTTDKKKTKKIVELLEEKLRKECEDQQCWAEKYSNNAVSSFVPRAMWTVDDTWLYSSDISRVLSQYEKKFRPYSGYVYGGIFTSDSADPTMFRQGCYDRILCDMTSSDSLYKRGRLVGTVWNTDTRYGYGVHWVSVVYCKETNIVYYYDSSGNSVIPGVVKYANQIGAKGVSVLMSRMNNHQKMGGECGMFAISHQIYCSMCDKKHSKRETNDYLNSYRYKKLTDADMVRARFELFNF